MLNKCLLHDYMNRWDSYLQVTLTCAVTMSLGALAELFIHSVDLLNVYFMPGAEQNQALSCSLGASFLRRARHHLDKNKTTAAKRLVQSSEGEEQNGWKADVRN